MSYILVTGSNGYIGSKLTKNLVEKGYKVLGVATSENSVVLHSNLEYIQLNLTDSISVERLFDKYEISSVIHLAAIAHLKGRKHISWNEYYRVNVLASKTIFQCAINAGANIFYSSTVDVYGDPAASIISEDHTTKPITDYAKSKFLAENILREKVNKKSVNYCIGRFAPVYAKDLMKDIYKRIYLKHPSVAFKIDSSGLDYHFVSVNNIIDFISLWLEQYNKISGIYNICDSELINSNEFINLERGIGNAQRIVRLPKNTLYLLNGFLNLSSSFVRNNLLNKVNKNLYKLIEPPIYSTEKLKKLTYMRWNLFNTVYEEDKIIEHGNYNKVD